MTSAEKIKFLVYTTVFGALWGMVELMLGTYLQLLNVPFRGAVMAGIGGTLLCAGRIYTPRRFATLSTGFVAAAIKIFSCSAFKFGPVSGILMEALIIEAVLSLGGLNKLSVFLSLVAASFEGVPHFFVTSWLMYGGDIFSSYMEAVNKIQRMLGLAGDFWVKALFIWMAGHLLIGVVFGAAAVAVTGRLKREA